VEVIDAACVTEAFLGKPVSSADIELVELEHPLAAAIQHSGTCNQPCARWRNIYFEAR
jgi:hypothetical protein